MKIFNINNLTPHRFILVYGKSDSYKKNFIFDILYNIVKYNNLKIKLLEYMNNDLCINDNNNINIIKDFYKNAAIFARGKKLKIGKI